jgi:hypothetical protein
MGHEFKHLTGARNEKAKPEQRLKLNLPSYLCLILSGLNKGRKL